MSNDTEHEKLSRVSRKQLECAAAVYPLYVEDDHLSALEEGRNLARKMFAAAGIEIDE